jgi:AraC-like DNA-binding protein
MENHSYNIVSDAFVFTISAEKEKESDRFLSESILVSQLSGQLTLETNIEKVVINPGDTLLVRKHQFVKVTKTPINEEYQKAILFILKDDILRKYAIENQIETSIKYKGQSNILIPENAYLKGFFNSLIPYTLENKNINNQLSIIKVNEAIELILLTKPDLTNFLFDFSEPHKIDLEKFMLSNFRFNVPIENFARLTGRSLAGFKRDFHKIFGMPPRQWLQNKRLLEAHFQIEKNNKKPSAIYFELGFESLSHFSYAFKKQFGYAPTELTKMR